MNSSENRPGKAAPDKRTSADVLKSKLAGTWYTAAPNQLKSQIEGYLEEAEEKDLENVIGMILPHAGYPYSGSTAAFGIKQIKDKDYNRVIVMGPTHQYPIRNGVSIPDVSHYATPLGEVPLDSEFISRLQEESFVESRPEVHQSEHSVQIQLPLIQSALPDFKLVPIVCGQLDLETAKKLGDALRQLVDDKTLVVASSDFTHYGPRFGYMPFKKDVPANLEKLDMGAFKFIEKKDPAAFANYIAETGATICGQVPITVLLSMLPEGSAAELLQYTTSGEVTGDYANSVSYLSAAFTGSWKGGQEKSSAREKESEQQADADAYLSEKDKESLLALARSTLAYYEEKGKKPTPEDLGIEVTDNMKQQMGAFVTLHKNGQLRGCIGEIIPRRELYKAVMDHALNAALRDHRFPPVKQSELNDIDFEISALSPPKPVDSYKDIEIGKHGVVLQKGRHSAVFLPQVAPEQGWGVEETLTQLALKAGLQADEWRDGAQFQVFEATVFKEA